MDWEPLILVCLILNALTTVFMARMLARIVQDEVLELDAKVALAMKQLIEGGMGDFEPPNPLQAALAELLVARVKGESSPAVEVLRDESGRFANFD